MRKTLSGLIYALSAVIGILAFVYPFFLRTPLTGHVGTVHRQDAPLITAALVGLSLVALLVELQGQAISAKTVAMLGVLIAITSVLRFVEVAVPMPGGFSPIFAPIILAGYVFGGRFGFLMGAFTLLVSGLITGGVGPWLPYQMFAAGWAGLMAGWLSHLTGRAGRFRKFIELFSLCVFGFVWGLLYGVIINLYFWPFAATPAAQSWTPGLGLKEALVHYATFYVVTSLGWDLMRAVGNVALLLLLGRPVILALMRFRRRFYFEVCSVDA